MSFHRPSTTHLFFHQLFCSLMSFLTFTAYARERLPPIIIWRLHAAAQEVFRICGYLWWAQPNDAMWTMWTIHLPNQCLLLFLCIVASIVGRRKDVIGTNQLDINQESRPSMYVLLGSWGRRKQCLIRQPFWCQGPHSRNRVFIYFLSLLLLPISSPS
jgi:hypothetical protein